MATGLEISGASSRPEGNSGSTPFVFTVSRSGDQTFDTLVDYYVWGQTSADDFTGATGGTLRFAPGEVSKTITIQVVGDSVAEADETFNVALSNARGGAITSGDASAVIQNDDGVSGGTDHQPIARADTDSVRLGSSDPATGNVITDASAGDAGDDDSGADEAGPDGPLTIVALRTTHTADTDPAGGFVQTGRFGALTMQANGAYSYTRTSNPEPGVTDVFGYEVRDADGDTATASLSIRIDANAAGGGGSTSGQVYTASGPGASLTGGPGNDTFHASQGYDTITGGAGADVLVLGKEPWAPITFTDFKVGEDKIDLSALFQQYGYAGSDPVGDKWVYLASNGSGGTIVRFDHDAAGPNPQWPNTIIDLQNVAPGGVTWAQLAGSAGSGTGSGGTGGGSGQVLTSPGPNSTLTGGDGNDTLIASQGYDRLTGGGGADVFAFPKEPWAPIEITDFTPGVDKLDLRALFDASGYAGTNPMGDRYMYVESNGAGGSILRFDRDAGGANPVWPNTIIELETVAPAQVSSSDWIVQ